MKIKICGITTLADALLCSKLGAWAIGFNFYPKSSRYISPTMAADIIARLDENITTVGVFVNESAEMIKDIQIQTNIDIVQLHGDETPDFCEQLSGKIIKAFKADKNLNFEYVQSFLNVVGILLDTSSLVYGGSGQICDWDVAKQFARMFPTVLAGGLNDGNVLHAHAAVAPLAMDICSGVEESSGIKSAAKLYNLFNVLDRGKI